MIKIILNMVHCHKILTEAWIGLSPDYSKNRPVSIFKK